MLHGSIQEKKKHYLGCSDHCLGSELLASIKEVEVGLLRESWELLQGTAELVLSSWFTENESLTNVQKMLAAPLSPAVHSQYVQLLLKW